MANDKKAAEATADTTKRVSTGFWAIIDEIKDDVWGTIKKLMPYGVGALFIVPMLLTKEGRTVIDEGAQYLKLKYGEQIGARIHDWGHRANRFFFRTILPMVIAIVGLGLYALIVNTEPRDVADRLPGMFWNMMILSIIWVLGFARLAPLIGMIGASVGTIGAIDQVTWETLRSTPRFLMSGGKSGIAWIDTWWRITTKGPMLYCAGAIWLTMTPLHNDPAMKYLAGLLILGIFFAHMAYKPGERGPFWWWVNWATAFILADVMFWCMFPVLKLVFGLGVTPAHLAMVQERWPELMMVHMTFDNNEWWRILATVVAAGVIGAQIWWTVHLARNSGRPAVAGRSGAAAIFGGVTYQRAPGFAPNYIGWIVTGLVVLGIVFMAFRHELFFRSNPMPAKIVQKELGLLNWWLPGVVLEPYRESETGNIKFRMGFGSQPPVIEGNKRFPDTQAGIVRLGANPDSFMVVIDPQVGGGQTIGRAINRGEVFNYRFVDASYAADSSGHTIRVPVDGWRHNGRTVNPNKQTDLANHCLTLRANYGQVCLRVGEEGTPIGLRLPGGSVSGLMGGQSLAFAFNLMQISEGLAQTSGKIRIIVWIDRTDKA